jgi:predicted porin
MKNVSKLALFVAAGMLSAGANASTIVLAEEGTSLSLSGDFTSEYIVNETVDSSQTGDKNNSDLTGEATLGVTAERSFGTFDGYVEIGYSFATQSNTGSDVSSDGAVAGFTGDFGQIEVGDTDSVYEDLIHDAVDIFEQASLSYGDYDLDKTSAADGDNMITYYTPEMNGVSLNLQVGILDEAENSGNTDNNLIVSAAYDFGLGALHVGYNDFGVKDNSSDELLGLAAVFGIGAVEISLAHEMQTLDGANTDFTGLTATVNYGPGDVYAGIQSVSPDASDEEDLSQYAVGINAEIADGLSTYAEYGNNDGQADADQDTVMAVGFAFDF